MDEATPLSEQLATSVSRMERALSLDVAKSIAQASRHLRLSVSAVEATNQQQNRTARALEEAVRPLNEMKRKIEEASRPSVELAAQIEAITKPSRQLRENLERLVALSKELTAQLEAIAKPSRQLRESMERLMAPSKELTAQYEQFSRVANAAAKIQKSAATSKIAEQIAKSYSRTEETLARLNESFEPSVESARRLSEMLKVATASHDALTELGSAREALVSLRAQAVARANAEGLSYEDIGQVLDVSKPLVQQMVQLGKRLDTMDDTLEEILGRLARIEDMLSLERPRLDERHEALR